MMTSRIEPTSPFTKGGVAALACAIGLCGLGLGQQTRTAPPPGVLVLVLMLGAGGLVVILTRVRLPQMLKLVCIAATLGVMLLTVARSDLFGIKHSSAKIGHAIDGDDVDGTPARTTGSAPIAGRAGAKVELIASSQGDLGWAQQLNSDLSGRIGGPESMSLRFAGNVAAHDDNGQRIVSADWEISGSGRSIRCGATSIAGRDQAAVIDQFRFTFEAAAARSRTEGHVTCF